MPYSTSFKCCLNCAYWEGCRKVALSGRWESESNTTHGECRKGSRINPGATAECSDFLELPTK